MLLTLGGGGWGAMYKEMCFAHLMLGHAPYENLKFRPSEITSGAFSSKFTPPMNGPHH